MPVELSNGFKTSWYAFSSLPPHADQTVTSVDDAVWLLPPPDEQAIRSNTPRPPAIARELSLAKTSVINSPPQSTLSGSSQVPYLLPSSREPQPGARVRRQEAL